jgi:hypothetical protein
MKVHRSSAKEWFDVSIIRFREKMGKSANKPTLAPGPFKKRDKLAGRP